MNAPERYALSHLCFLTNGVLNDADIASLLIFSAIYDIIDGKRSNW